MHGFFRQLEIAEQTDQGRENPDGTPHPRLVSRE